jgi:polysaccharide export outer membrane protein
MNSGIRMVICAVLLCVPKWAISQPLPDGTTNSPAATKPPEKADFPDRHPRYELQRGDMLDIQFSPTAEYNQTLAVQPDGYISLREAGDLYVLGKTVSEVREAIKAAYRSILHDPEITVLLKDFDRPHFTATGQVGRPGRYDLRADTTVSEALAIAGGLTEKSKANQVLLFRRVSNDWVETKMIDVKALYNGRLVEDIHLRPGDLIFVPQNRFSKIKPFIPVWALSTYVNPAGGL